MDEKKFVAFKKDELAVKRYITEEIGKGRIAGVSIEYTPVGERIIIATSRPGQVIGKRGEKIEELTRVLKKRFKLDNPHIDIKEILDARLDAQLVADDIAIQMERQGTLKFKIIAYKMLQDIMGAGAMGAEIVLSGRLPSERAKSWRFSQGYLKKTGEPAKVVQRAMAQSVSNMGVSGIKVSILPPKAHIHDKITVDKALLEQVHLPVEVTPVVKKMRSVRKTKKGVAS
jgi:small subunit ribosomal protein S3